MRCETQVDHQPTICGESSYDRVTSLLMSMIVGSLLIVGWLWLVHATNRAYAKSQQPRINIIKINWGGEENGDPAALNAPISDSFGPAELAPGAIDARTLIESGDPVNPSILDPFANPSNRDDQPEIVNGPQPRGRHSRNDGMPSSVRSLRPPGYGPGNGGGTAPENRWVFDFAAGQTEDDYARLLDAFGIELATPVSSTMLAYASHFSGAPITRTALHRLEQRIYFSWSNQARRQFDIGLLRKAGVSVDDGELIIQFLPDAVQERLTQLEQSFRNRALNDIRKTRFRIVAAGNSFDFQVAQQEYMK